MDRTYTDTSLMAHTPSFQVTLPSRSRDLNDYAREFLAETNNPNTRRAYAVDLRDFLESVKGNLSDEALLVYKEFVVSETAPRTARRRLGVINSFLHSLVAKGVLARNPYAHVRNLCPKVDKFDSPTIALTDAEVRLMVNHPDRSTLLGATQRMCLILSFQLGLRVSELLAIKVGDVTGSTLKVRGKGGKTRTLPLDDFLMEEITSYLTVTTLLLERTRAPGEFLVVSQKGLDGSSKVITWTINRWYKDIAEKCGIRDEKGNFKHVTSHTGRATAVTKLLDGQVPLREVANFAGHSSLDTTMIYDKKKRETKVEVIKKIRY